MISQIHAVDTYRVRQAVLRKGMPEETCRFEGDNLPFILDIPSTMKL
jgi:hypothetical protein